MRKLHLSRIQFDALIDQKLSPLSSLKDNVEKYQINLKLFLAKLLLEII